jgi:DNA-binding SARP family transcriptional activator/Tfp pilus assembly protein PilF
MAPIRGVAGLSTIQMEFCLLGPLVVRRAGVDVLVAGSKQRAVLAVLLLNASRMVPVEELTETLWGSEPPSSAQAGVRNHVKRLRHALGAPDRERISTGQGGYMIRVQAGELDVSRFEDMLGSARAAEEAGLWERAADLARQALSLWRGEPLADVGSELLALREAPRLAEMRLQALDLRIEADLRLGRHADAIAELRRLTSAHPLRERLHGQLMLALHQCGRQAEALAAYQDARRVLLDELGTEPGTALHAVHQQILTGDPVLAGPAQAGPPAAPPASGGRAPDRPGLVVPQQLPGPVRRFTGRDRELVALTELLEQQAATPPAMVISGTAGVGKTALAVHWAHQAAARFPDGQLYLNLRGFDPSERPVPPAEAFGALLEGLGVSAERIPASLQARAGLYRSLLSGRRILVVLDNARDAGQARPLLPGTPGCVVLVTSRRELAGLVATEGAHTLKLDLLSEAEAWTLLAVRLGAARLRAEPQAAAELIGLCARLPLALVIAAARISARPGFGLDAFTQELKDARQKLDALDAGDPAGSVRAVFSCSLEGLPAPSARMFRLLGLHPGPDTTIAAAASLAGTPQPQARRVLEELAEAHLITEHAPRRFVLHDLLRAYATEQIHACVSGAIRREAIGRLLGYYVATSSAAALLLNPSRGASSLSLPEVPAGVSPDALAGPRQALAWYDADNRSLVAAAVQAAAEAFDTQACLLAWALTDFLDRRGRWQEWVTVQQAALTSATRLGDRALQARAERSLGRACTELGALPDAVLHLRRALELDRQLGNHGGQANTHLALARVFEFQDDYDQALSQARQGLDLLRAAGNVADEAMALNGVGWFHAQLGDHGEALSCCEEALSLYQRTQDRRGEATTCDSLGYIHHQLGHYDQAGAWYRQALGILGEIGAHTNLVNTFNHLGDTCQAAGDPGNARANWQQALAILDDLQDSGAAQVRAKIEQLAP